MPLSIFGFRALWSPYFMIFCLLLIAGYFYLTVKQRHKFANSEPLKISQAILFVLAMILLYVTKGSPVDLVAHIMFTFHMVQMAFLYLVIPPILISSIPNWVWLHILEYRYIKKIFAFFTKPLIALILFNGIFSIYHIPLIMDAVKMNIVIHAVYTVVLFVLAIFLWWPLLNKLEGQYQLHGLKKIGYILGDGVLLTPACGMIIFAPAAMYATYTDGEMWMKAMALCVPGSTLSGLSISGPELFTNMPAQEDQQLGGVLMKIIQEIVLGVMLMKVFFEWYKKEQREGDQINNDAILHHEPRPVE
ncbi:cytochrome c oxidase assembly factor CtaG [Lederbergia citrea]|uniref:Cytochrome c oxidase assembly factor CtaG n=1 Tax=Lederbergia citrea TaxID=2833581 RepID=A0A942Z1H6_9BACI|nr:cytochrome c oxidase assembly factor CtaG [Lederbergia citrea]MBS4177249.1 cytochrome c oxidase assembly factor CtaG [Lederbergia citrea]MBS4203912.1 cytochrome c oxidase assembly factor CtaG [Lederbergia citrea]MBS4221503.1 cytochrome c oxidase assembly factor CtaG [Lederbergia citrea]